METEKKQRILDGWKAVTEARARLDEAERSGRELSADEKASIDRALEDGSKMFEEAQSATKAEKLRALADAITEAQRPMIGEAVAKATETPEYAEAFDGFVRKGVRSEVLRKADETHIAGDDARGGYLVPPEFLRRLLEQMAPYTPVLGLATSMDISTNAIEIPKVDTYGSATWLGEEDAYTQDADTFTNMTIYAHKLGRIQKVSEELLADSAFDVAGFLASSFARSFGLAVNAALTSGDGDGKPYGFAERVDSGMNKAISAAPTADELIDLKHAVAPWYRSESSVWQFTDATLAEIAKIKDDNDQYLWLPSLRDAEPGRLLGHRVVINPDMDELGAGNKAVAFGDFSYLMVVRRPGVALQRLGELYAATGQVGFRAALRIGADLSDTTSAIAIGAVPAPGGGGGGGGGQ